MCQARVKTPCGLTQNIDFQEIIMQGSVFGSVKCSVQFDGLGKEMLSSEEVLGLYRCKHVIDITILISVKLLH